MHPKIGKKFINMHFFLGLSYTQSDISLVSDHSEQAIMVIGQWPDWFKTNRKATVRPHALKRIWDLKYDYFNGSMHTTV